MKLLYCECLTDGTKIFHYLKENGSITLRVEISRENSKIFMKDQVPNIRLKDPMLAEEVATIFGINSPSTLKA